MLQDVYEEVVHGRDLVDLAGDIQPLPTETYDLVMSQHPQETTTVVNGDPVMRNPCSYRAVSDVFQNLKGRLLSDNRRWCILGCDGLPYVLGSRLIDDSDNLKKGNPFAAWLRPL